MTKEKWAEKAIIWVKKTLGPKINFTYSSDTPIVSYNLAIARRTYLRMMSEDPEHFDHYMREFLRLRALKKYGLVFQINTMDGTGKSYPLIPFLYLGSPYQYTIKNAR